MSSLKMKRTITIKYDASWAEFVDNLNYLERKIYKKRAVRKVQKMINFFLYCRYFSYGRIEIYKNVPQLAKIL